MAEGELTPMMKQYQSMRQSLPEDVLLLFRLGDFYEMFFEDAKVAAGILNLALTKRNSVPMCGVPHHSAEGYIRRLVKAGKRVAIAEQTSEPQPGKLVERELAQVISAGSITDVNSLDARRNNYLAAVWREGKSLGLAFVDNTTGDFRLTEFSDVETLMDELGRIMPAEVLHSDEQGTEFAALKGSVPLEAYAFLHDQAFYMLREHFRVQSLDGFGCAGMTAATGAAGAILHYLKTVLRRDLTHIRRLRTYHPEHAVIIDTASRANLDLVTNRAGNEHTLLHALDRTATPMGARKLRDWILHPLRDLPALLARQDVIEAMVQQPFVLSKVRDGLKSIRDVERTLTRLGGKSGSPRDLQILAVSLAAVPEVRQHVQALQRSTNEQRTSEQRSTGFQPVEPPSPEQLTPAQPFEPVHGCSAGMADHTGRMPVLLSLAADLASRLRDFPEMVELVQQAIVDEPPGLVKDGGIFRDGYLPALDELRNAATLGRQWIADLQAREIERTGIKSLKVKFNAVFGYFIEITKSNLGSVPGDYTRKQTTATGERYYTPELKEMEDKILGADERAKRLEQEEFLKLRGEVLAHMAEIQETAEALATLDVLAGLAETARLFHYCRPLLNESLNLYIRDGRHPVLDQNLAEEKFVPNDVLLEPQENRLILLTGPNMAGKSTYIRQVALLTLMAQIGSFIPASSAEIGLVDRIFTRVGASDDISRGQSTFMVEMNETAAILNNATDRSLVILDEIGRGTATFDGLAIAWSVAEHLHDTVQCRALFATHYHELTALAQKRPSVKNANVAVREWNDRIIFLRKIVPGAADKSYGIQVARLAGLPAEIISRAREILSHLEAQAGTPEGAGSLSASEIAPGTIPAPRPRKKKADATDVDGPQSRQPELALFG